MVIAPRAAGALAILSLTRAVACAQLAASADSRSIERALADLRDAGARSQVTSAQLSEFWRATAAHGTPIVEPIVGDASQVRVTFLYRDTASARNVIVSGGLAGHVEALAQLERMPGTDIWHKTIDVRADARIGYQFRVNDNLVPIFADTGRDARVASGFPDPLNPRVLAEDPRRSLFEGPAAPPEPWIAIRKGVPRGRVRSAGVDSRVLGTTRGVRVYTPPGLDDAGTGAMPLLVVFDGDEYTETAGIPTPTILDNLIAAGRIQPLIAVFVANPAATRMADLAPNERFADFVTRELMPWIESRWNIARDPSRRTIAGSSLGGLMASYIALRSPAVFGNVISQSGSYWWSPAGDGESEWLARRLVDEPRVPVRFFIEVGVFEIERSRGGGPGQVVPNRHFRDVLRAKGYDVSYREVAGGHEAVSWRGTFSDGIEHFLHQQ